MAVIQDWNEFMRMWTLMRLWGGDGAPLLPTGFLLMPVPVMTNNRA